MEKQKTILNGLISESSVQPIMETYGLNENEARKIVLDAREKLGLE